MGADPQDGHDTREYQENRKGGQKGAGSDGGLGGREGELNRFAEPVAYQGAVGKSLHGFDRGNGFGCVGGGFRQCVLGGASAAADCPSYRHDRKYN